MSRRDWWAEEELANRVVRVSVLFIRKEDLVSFFFFWGEGRGEVLRRSKGSYLISERVTHATATPNREREYGNVPHKKRIPHSREIDHLRNVNGVHGPRKVSPRVSLPQTRHVAPKRRPRLAEELLVELARVAQRREQRALGGVLLHAHPPAVAEHPPRDVVVVVRVQRAEPTTEEHLAAVAPAEVGVLVDLGAEGGRAARDDEDAAVEVGLRAELEVVALEVEAGDEVGEGGPEAAGGVAQDFLVGAHEADLGVVEGGEDVFEETGSPEGGVIDADRDGVLFLVDAVARLQDLASLVRLIELDDHEFGMGEARLEAVDAQNLLNVLFQLDAHG